MISRSRNENGARFVENVARFVLELGFSKPLYPAIPRSRNENEATLDFSNDCIRRFPEVVKKMELGSYFL